MRKKQFLKVLVEQGKGVTASGYSVDVSKMEIKDHEVPVRFGFEGEEVGTAKLRKENGQIFADIVMEKPFPKEAMQMWPAIGIQGVETEGKLLTAGNIYEVSLCARPNVDSTIPPLTIKKNAKK